MLRAGVFLAMLARTGATYECCAGGDDGCVGTKLQIGDGDCDTDDDCAGDLRCGTDNCGRDEGFDTSGWPAESECSWDTTDDCCCRPTSLGGGCTTLPEDGSENVCLSEDKCPYRCCAGSDDGCNGQLKIGDGDCDHDSDCEGDLKCGKDNCGRTVQINIPGLGTTWHSWPFESSCGWDQVTRARRPRSLAPYPILSILQSRDRDIARARTPLSPTTPTRKTDDCCCRETANHGCTTTPEDGEDGACVEVDGCAYHCCGGKNDGCRTKIEWLHIGDGDCDIDDDCAGALVCGTDNCGRDERLDISRWPVDSECGWDTTDDCCCRPTDDGGCTTLPEDQALTTKCLEEDGCGAVHAHGGGGAAVGKFDGFWFAMGGLAIAGGLALALALAYCARRPSEAKRCVQIPLDLCEHLGLSAPKAYRPVSRPGGGAASVQLAGGSDGGESEYVAPAWGSEM